MKQEILKIVLKYKPTYSDLTGCIEEIDRELNLKAGNRKSIPKIKTADRLPIAGFFADMMKEFDLDFTKKTQGTFEEAAKLVSKEWK